MSKQQQEHRAEPYGKRSAASSDADVQHVPSAMLDTARPDGCAAEISCVRVCVTSGLLHSSLFRVRACSLEYWLVHINHVY